MQQAEKILKFLSYLCTEEVPFYKLGNSQITKTLNVMQSDHLI